MSTMLRRFSLLGVLGSAAVGILAACTSMPAERFDASLAGTNEVPPVVTSGSGSGSITINPTDRSVSVKITVTGMTATAAHIHEGARGTNGPVIVPLTMTQDANTFVSAPDAKLTEAQYASYTAGNLYLNVHSAKNPGGEIRAQLIPPPTKK